MNTPPGPPAPTLRRTALTGALSFYVFLYENVKWIDRISTIFCFLEQYFHFQRAFDEDMLRYGDWKRAEIWNWNLTLWLWNYNAVLASHSSGNRNVVLHMIISDNETWDSLSVLLQAKSLRQVFLGTTPASTACCSDSWSKLKEELGAPWICDVFAFRISRENTHAPFCTCTVPYIGQKWRCFNCFK